MPQQLVVSETFDFQPSSRVMLDNGFMRVTGKAARTGVYQYLASELGLTDREPNEIVNVYRPHDEVFNVDSLSSYANVDVTNDHPSEMVDATTFKSVSVGHVIDAVESGDFVDVTLIIKDDAAIRDVQSGKAQLSPGYTAVYVAEKGVSPQGEHYDFKQTSIDINHVAIVKRGRGGDQVRINDNQPGVQTMTVKVTLDSGRTVEVENEATATLVNDSIERLTQQAKDAEMKAEKAEAKADKAEEDLEKERKKSDDSAIALRVKEIAEAQTSARRIAGDSFTCDSVNSIEIKRAALSTVRDSIDWAAKSESYVEAAFDMAIESASNEQLSNFSKDAATTKTDDSAPVSSFRDDFLKGAK